jgi:hypothetical protein
MNFPVLINILFLAHSMGQRKFYCEYCNKQVESTRSVRLSHLGSTGHQRRISWYYWTVAGKHQPQIPLLTLTVPSADPWLFIVQQALKSSPCHFYQCRFGPLCNKAHISLPPPLRSLILELGTNTTTFPIYSTNFAVADFSFEQSVLDRIDQIHDRSCLVTPAFLEHVRSWQRNETLRSFPWLAFDAGTICHVNTDHLPSVVVDRIQSAVPPSLMQWSDTSKPATKWGEL